MLLQGLNSRQLQTKFTPCVLTQLALPINFFRSQIFDSSYTGILCLLSVFIADKCKKVVYLKFANTETFFKNVNFCTNLKPKALCFFILTSTIKTSVETLRKNIDLNQFQLRTSLDCSNQQPPQRGRAVHDPV